MNIKHLPILLLLIVLLVNCSSKNEQAYYPSDFSFQLDRVSIKYDSRTQKYDYYDKVVIVPLTDHELRLIYEFARDINYLRFPNGFTCDEPGPIPCFTDRLKVTYNHRYKESSNDDCCSKKEKDRPAKFDLLVAKITEILDSKEQVKNLPKYNVIFM